MKKEAFPSEKSTLSKYANPQEYLAHANQKAIQISHVQALALE